MTVSIKDISGIYSTSTPGFTVDFTELRIRPPVKAGKFHNALITLATDTPGNEITGEIIIDYQATTATTNFGWGATMPLGEKLSFELDLTFRFEDQEWTFDGTLQDYTKHPRPPAQPILGVNALHSAVTEDMLIQVKEMYPDNETLQKATLEQVLDYLRSVPLDGSGVKLIGPTHPPIKPGAAASCALSVGMVVIDCILLFTQTIGMAKKIKSSGTVTQALDDYFDSIEEPFEIWRAITAVRQAVGAKAKVAAMWGVIKTLNAIGILKKVVGMMLSGLSVWDFIAFVVLILGTLLSALFLGEFVLIGQVLALSALIGTLLLDVDHAYTNCDMAVQTR